MGKTLLQKFKYPIDMLPLMYVLLKDDNGDFEKTCSEVEEGLMIFFVVLIILTRLSFLFLGQHAVHEYIFVDENPKPSEDEVLLDKSQQLLRKYSYPFETSPLMYMVLKTCNGDIEKACQEIENGM